MDDFTTYDNNFDEALENLAKVLKICKKKKISLSTEKCHMMMNEGVVLGHYIFFTCIKVDLAKVEVILKIPTPKTQHEVRSFLGHVGYYRFFIEDFSKLASPLFQLLSKDMEFNWIDHFQLAFGELKKRLSEALVLHGLDWNLPFHISSNASDTTIEKVLGYQEEKNPYVIQYISKNLSPTEVNYTVIEKEFLIIVYTINKLWHYIIGYPIILHTYHSVIKYLLNKTLTNGRITRWLLLLQQFDMTIIDKNRKDNVISTLR